MSDNLEDKGYWYEMKLTHDPLHPGRIIKEACLEQEGLSIAAAARRLGVTRQGLSQLLYGQIGITARMAIKLEEVGWGSAEGWLAQQADYDLWRAGYRGSISERSDNGKGSKVSSEGTGM